MPYGWRDDSVQAAQGLLQRAQAGDRAAEDQLRQAAQTWSPQHRNAAIDALNSLDPTSHLGHVHNEHGFLGDWGEKLGSVLKVAAPIAGALIPGVGMLGAMAIGAGGSAAGGALHHDKFDLLKTLAAGGASAAGNNALGNGLGGVAPRLPGAPAIPTSGGVPGETNTAVDANVGGVTSTTTPVGAMSPPALPAAPSSGGGLFGGFKTPNGQLDLSKLAPIAAGGLGVMESRSKRNSMERLYGQQFNMQKAQTGQAEQQYADKQGRLNSALSTLGGLKAPKGIYGG